MFKIPKMLLIESYSSLGHWIIFEAKMKSCDNSQTMNNYIAMETLPPLFRPSPPLCCFSSSPPFPTHSFQIQESAVTLLLPPFMYAYSHGLWLVSIVILWSEHSKVSTSMHNRQGQHQYEWVQLPQCSHSGQALQKGCRQPGPENQKSPRQISTGYPLEGGRISSGFWPMRIELTEATRIAFNFFLKLLLLLLLFLLL